MSVTAWLTVAVFATVYVLIATERVHRVTAALGGAVVMLVLGATSPEHAFFSDVTGIDWNVNFLLLGMMLIVAVLKRTGPPARRRHSGSGECDRLPLERRSHRLVSA